MLDSCDLAVDQSVFQGNVVSTSVPSASWAEAQAQGGAISARWSSGSVRGSQFVANRADSNVTGFGPIASAHGYALSLASSAGQGFEVDQCHFSENSGLTTSNNQYYQGAGSSVAAVAFGYGGDQQANHVVRDCTFKGNRSVKAPLTNGASIADIGCIGNARMDVSRCRFAGAFASPLTETIAGFGQWNGSVRALNNPGVPSSTLADSVFCELDCLATGSEITASGIAEFDHCCPADLNQDGQVNGSDIAVLLGFWGPTGTAFPATDINQDGIVNGSDLAAVLTAWGACAP